MKKGIKKFISSPLFKKLVVAGAVAAAAAGTAALVNTFKKKSRTSSRKIREDPSKCKKHLYFG
jgi:archaellum component FlaG (FlaF/FlaG flagellin family)